MKQHTKSRSSSQAARAQGWEEIRILIEALRPQDQEDLLSLAKQMFAKQRGRGDE